MAQVNRNRTLITVALSMLMLLVAGSFFLLFNRQNSHTELLVEYQASRIANELMEAHLGGVRLDLSEVDERVRSFGIYAPDGEAVVRVGNAPKEFVPTPVSRPQGFVRRRGDVVRYARLLGRMGQRDMPMRRGMGRSGPMASPGYQWMVADIFVGDLLQRQRVNTALFAGYALMVAGFAVTTFLLYRKLRTYQDREASQRRLVQLGEAARTLAHEIKNPLGAIRMQQAILKRQLPEEHTPSLSIIAEETNRIAALTDRVRDFLRNPEGTPESVSLPAVARTVAERTDHPVSVETPDRPVVVVFDPERLRSLIENLVRNAVETSPEGSPVEVAVRDGRTFAELVVADRGSGVPAADKERVFDPFYTTKDSGSGIGLAIARNFVEAAGGRIELQDRPGGGTVVHVNVPKERQAKEGLRADSGR